MVAIMGACPPCTSVGRTRSSRLKGGGAMSRSVGREARVCAGQTGWFLILVRVRASLPDIVCDGPVGDFIGLRGCATPGKRSRRNHLEGRGFWHVARQRAGAFVRKSRKIRGRWLTPADYGVLL